MTIRRATKRAMGPAIRQERCVSHKGIAKTEWSFLWFQNDYTVSTTSTLILTARAAVAAAGEAK
ncbi:hypothetical protein HMP09_0592 [Sphingomonas sp. HMP9]|nr:hypothetical protein HMP09_0592 [Sphingomonas sp. HMP9]